MTEDEIKALKASRQSRLEGAITPTNGRGGYAPRYSPPPSTVKPPTWDYWRHMPTVKPWQACALALNIEPDSVDYRPESWDGQPETWDGFPSEVRDHFIKLLQLLDANQFEKQHFTENFRMGVRLSEFAAWCAHVGFAIPPELSALATLPERPQVAPKVVAAPVISQSGNGQLTVLIDGREALPVRAIPHVTGWIFHPDKIVFCLKSSSKTRLPSLSEEPHLSINKKRIYKHEAGATLTAYHIPGNEPVQMKHLEWRGVEVQLKGLESELKLKYGEEGRGNDIGCAEWERATVPVLPAGAFVWLDDFKKFRHWTFNKGDSPDATELMLTPCLDADIRAMVMEGFEERKTATKKEPYAITAKAENSISINFNQHTQNHNQVNVTTPAAAPADEEQAASGTNDEAAPTPTMDMSGIVYWRTVLYDNIRQFDKATSKGKANVRQIIKNMKNLRDERILNTGSVDELIWLDDMRNELTVAKQTVSNAISKARKLPI